MSDKQIKHIKGVTLIEMVMIIVILGTAIPILLRAWGDVAWRSVRSEALADATVYAQELMEEIKSRSFDESAVAPWSGALGPDPGETISGVGAAGFDDADDYQGYADTPATGYTRSVNVRYVLLNAGVSPARWDNSGSQTDYKKIMVTLSRTDNAITDVRLSTIMSAH
jgi:type II secretory pathway pseudopilin PulG